jgi:hypothetical protein
MSRRERPRHCGSCQKRIYENQTKAYRFALICSRRAGHGLRVYPCPQGNGFHLTKQVQRVAAA